MRLQAVENKTIPGAFVHREFRHHTFTGAPERHFGTQAEIERGGVEIRASMPELKSMGIAAIIEGRPALQPKPHLPAHDADSANQKMLVVLQIGADRHIVNDFADSRFREKPRDENVRIGPIELFGGCLRDRTDSKTTALAGIQYGAEHARRIEPWKAEPIDGSIFRNERDGAEITNHTVIFYRSIRH